MKSYAVKQFSFLSICVAFILGLSAAAGLWIGSTLWNPKSTDQSGIPDESAVESDHTKSSELTELESDSSALFGAQVATLEEIVQIDSEFSRHLALYNLVLEADEPQLLDLIDQSEDLPVLLEFDFQRVYVMRLYEINPEFAMSHAESFHPVLVRFMFQDWAQRHMEDAISRAKALVGTTREAALSGMLSSYSELSVSQKEEIARELGREDLVNDIAEWQQVSDIQRDPEQAWYEALRKRADDSDDVEALTLSANIWMRQSGLEVLDEISTSLENDHARDQILFGVVMTATQFMEIKDLFAKALELDVDIDNDNDGYVKKILSQWANKDKLGLLDSLSGMSDPDIQSLAAATLYERSGSLSDEQIEYVRKYINESDLPITERNLLFE
ncbi:MAG: hypothetical protein F4X44_08295 [Gammaproteobacteria bacterium]|nr:hypothetical protein [Gammaproteobacteria bacterium]MYD80597.1 hypothetical protein [Gammaproteobacteria bacterium]